MVREQQCQGAWQEREHSGGGALERRERRRRGQQLAQHNRPRHANALPPQVELRDVVLTQRGERDPAELGHRGVLQHHRMWWVGNTYQCPGTSAIVTRGLFTAKFLCVWVFGRVDGFLSAGAFFLDGEAPKPDWSRTRADCLPIANSSSSWLCARRLPRYNNCICRSLPGPSHYSFDRVTRADYILVRYFRLGGNRCYVLPDDAHVPLLDSIHGEGSDCLNGYRLLDDDDL